MNRGTPEWALDGFRRQCLPAFVSDLNAREASGFDNAESCPRVQRYLNEIADILESVPNVRPPAQPVAAEFREFAKLYVAWNNKEGDTPEVRQERARAHESLARKRDRLGNRIGQSLGKLQDKVDWGTMDALFGKLDAMVKDKALVGVFGYLGRNLDAFSRQMKKYRN